MSDSLEKYYDYLKQNGADVAPNFKSFQKTLSDQNNAKQYYDYLKNNNFDVPNTYESFSNTFGLKKKVSGEISSLTELPSEFIEPLKKGVEPPKPSKVVSSGLIIPTNLPKQEAQKFETEQKVNEAALNTLTDLYKQKGLKFDISKPAAQKQLQDYINKEKSNDLVKVVGKDGKEYLTRGTGFFETAAKAFGKSIIDPFESAQINFTNNPSELADLLDKKSAEEPKIPESAPSKFTGYLGGLVGGLPKMAALLAIPVFGESAMVIDMYHNSMANQRKELYERGKEQGLSREQAAKKAMQTAPTTAIPDAAMGYLMARGVGAGGKIAEEVTATTGKNILPTAAKKSFIDASAKLGKEAAIMGAMGGGSELGRGLLEKQAGYDVSSEELSQRALSGASEWALMHSAFKLMHVAPKAIASAAKNLLSYVPKPILEAEAETHPDGKQTLDEVEKFANTKTKVANLVPEEKVASVTGLTEKIDNIKTDIADLEEKKKTVPNSVAEEINNQIKDKNKEIDFYDNQVKKVINSKDITGINEEIDDVTGQKFGEIPKIEPKNFSKMSIEELEKRQSEIEDSKSGTPEYKEYNEIDKELQNREWRSVFDAPLDKVSQVIDDIMKKEKEMPYGYGSYMESKDARLSKEVIEKYSKENVENLSDNDIIKDFKDAMFGNPTTWYADGLKLKESLKEAQNRGIDVFDKYTQEFIKDGYTKEDAISAANRVLEPILKSIGKQTLIETKPTEEVKVTKEVKPTEVKAEVKVEEPKKTYQEVLKEKQQAEKKQTRQIAGEKAGETRKIIDESNKIETSDPRSAALKYLTGGKLSWEAIDEVAGRVKRAKLNIGERELKSEEARARDYVAKKGEGQSLDEAAHSIWDNLSEEMQGKMTTQEIKDALMTAISEHPSKVEAAKSLIDSYKEESIDEMEKRYYERYGENAENEIDKELKQVPNNQFDIEQELINANYESEKQFQDEYWNAKEATNDFTEKAPSIKTEKTKAAIEKGIEDVSRNEKRKIINSKFEELLNNEDFYNKFKIKSKCL